MVRIRSNGDDETSPLLLLPQFSQHAKEDGRAGAPADIERVERPAHGGTVPGDGEMLDIERIAPGAERGLEEFHVVGL